MSPLRLRSNTDREIRRGILLMIVGSLTIPLLDASAKLLTDRHGLSPGEVSAVRFLLQTLFAVPLVVGFYGTGALRLRRPVLNLLRGMILGVATISFFTALKFMPLADATAIFFIEPMILTLLSAVLLREPLEAKRIIAVLCGFAGALIVIRPNLTALGFVALLPMLTAMLVALYAILNRRLAETGPPLAMHLYSGLGGCIVTLPALLVGHALGIHGMELAPRFDAAIFGLFLVIAVVATVTHLMFIQAYHDAPASVLAPLGYIEIPSAVLLGLLIFGQLPDAMTVLGIAIIVLSGMAIVMKERRSAIDAPTPLQP